MEIKTLYQGVVGPDKLPAEMAAQQLAAGNERLRLLVLSLEEMARQERAQREMGVQGPASSQKNSDVPSPLKRGSF